MFDKSVMALENEIADKAPFVRRRANTAKYGALG